jgi:Helitron helicase-like domain at N-terminus
MGGSDTAGIYICKDCKANKTKKEDVLLPVWYKQGIAQYHVPPELSELREGEKLLIQQVSVFVPLHHLKFGQVGTRGHVISFSQDLSSLCKTLPRLPDNVETVRVIKRFKKECGEIGTKTFSIRKAKVMQALKWLKIHNTEYRDIEILESNLDWITNGIEEILPAKILHEIILPDLLSNTNQEDRGPSEAQIAAVQDIETTEEPFYGLLDEYHEDNPKEKDQSILQQLQSAREEGKSLLEPGFNNVITFPFVSKEPVCEYSEPRLFELAFPWLFPGGTGGMTSFDMKGKDGIGTWMKNTMLYKDMRFAKDRVWCFFALNFMTRHVNQNSGGFFVKNFFSQGPQSLEDLKQEIADGNLSWIHRISYYSQRVTGSSAYWRHKRQEINAWIHHHVEKGAGPPTFFITLSCAEYHWKDIERLIIDRCNKANLPIPDFSTESRVRLVNDHTAIVLEYFQQRVKAWLSTVGKQVLHIDHVWGKYEFAPSRGQIHFHLLAISKKNKENIKKCHTLIKDKRNDELAQYLGEWLEDTVGLTASVDECANDINLKDCVNPATYNFSDVQESETVLDTTKCQLMFQYHKCSKYCMRTRKHHFKSETEEEKKGSFVELEPESKVHQMLVIRQDFN